MDESGCESRFGNYKKIKIIKIIIKNDKKRRSLNMFTFCILIVYYNTFSTYKKFKAI